MSKLLVIDDNFELLESLNEWLTVVESHSVEVCRDGSTALELLDNTDFDAIILDWNMPGLSGLDVCRAFRAKGGETPIIFLTGKVEVMDKTFGLDSGADDYLTKPCDMRELSSRVRALLRRFKSLQTDIIRFRDLDLDPKARKLERAGEPLSLPPREFSLLEFLLRRRNEVFSTRQLARHVWASEDFATDQNVRTCIKRLRQYIDKPAEPSYIRNVHGHGYGMNGA